MKPLALEPIGACSHGDGGPWEGEVTEMAVNQCKHSELFRWYHLQSIDNNAIEECSEGVDGALVECDNQADLHVLVLDVVEVWLGRTTKRKASSDENIGEICEKVEQKNTESQGMESWMGWPSPQISQGI